MFLRKLTVVAVLLNSAAISNAQTTVHASTLFDWVISPPVHVGNGSENLVNFTLSIVNLTGDPDFNPQAFDSKATGFRGITGMLHQQDSVSLDTKTPTNRDGGLYSTDIDTHFLLNGRHFIALIGIGDPEEDRGVSPSAEPTNAFHIVNPFAETTFGSFLTTTLALNEVATDTWDFARIVVPNNTYVSVNGVAASADGHKDSVVDFTFLVSSGIPLSPAWGMGVCAALCLFSRRR